MHIENVYMLKLILYMLLVETYISICVRCHFAMLLEDECTGINGGDAVFSEHFQRTSNFAVCDLNIDQRRRRDSLASLFSIEKQMKHH